MSPPRRCSSASRRRASPAARRCRRGWSIRWAASVHAAARRRAAGFLRRGARQGARRHEQGDERAGRHRLCLAHPEPGFEMAGKTGTAQVRAYTKEEHAARHHQEQPPWTGSCATMPCSSASRRSTIRNTPSSASSSMAPTRAHPQVQMARDILLFAQKRDPLGMPTAYPVQLGRRAAAMQAGGSATARKLAEADGASSLCRRQAHAFHRRQAGGGELGPGAADHA